MGKIQNVSDYNQEINASILEFIDNLDECIEWCDFAICRCGAGTLSDISQRKRGMIMIPLPESIDNHQYFNAEPPIDHSKAASLMLAEIHKDNAAI